MGEVIELSGIADLEFRRTVKAVERFMREFLADGLKIAQSVRRQGEHVSRDRAHFDEARINLGIRTVAGTGHSWFWALPGDEWKVLRQSRLRLESDDKKPA